MIRRTFQHLPGVGPWREKDLWARGIRSWSDFPAPGGEVALSKERDDAARDRLAQGEAAESRKDLAALARLFPPREHWRLYREFRDQAAFFDIETDGKDQRLPTVVSVFAGGELSTFIQDRNLDDLPGTLARWPIWVTFNGSCFDVPILKGRFPELPEPTVHLDLRFLCRKARVTGGLKEVEDKLGFARPPHLRGVKGMDAVLLWRAYQRDADLEPLRFLVEYNLYDAFQLKSVMDKVYNRACDQLAFDDEPRIQVFERGEVLYDVSRLILNLPEA